MDMEAGWHDSIWDGRRQFLRTYFGFSPCSPHFPQSGGHSETAFDMQLVAWRCQAGDGQDTDRARDFRRSTADDERRPLVDDKMGEVIKILQDIDGSNRNSLNGRFLL